MAGDRNLTEPVSEFPGGANGNHPPNDAHGGPGANLEPMATEAVPPLTSGKSTPGKTPSFRPSANSGHRRNWRRPVFGLLSVGFAIGLYWLFATRTGANPALTPSPPMILEEGIDRLVSGNLLFHTVVSLRRVFIGFAIGTFLAVILGCGAGWFRYLGYVLNPLIDAIRPIPALAYIPLVIVWLGIGEMARISIIVLAVFKPCVVSTRQGMSQVPNIYVEAASTLGASKLASFWRVGLPSAVPYIMAGTRSGLATGFLALVAAELIAASEGLGFLISNAGQNLQIDTVLVGIVAIGLVASVMDAITLRIERHLTRWSDVRR